MFQKDFFDVRRAPRDGVAHAAGELDTAAGMAGNERALFQVAQQLARERENLWRVPKRSGHPRRVHVSSNAGMSVLAVGNCSYLGQARKDLLDVGQRDERRVRSRCVLQVSTQFLDIFALPRPCWRPASRS